MSGLLDKLAPETCTLIYEYVLSFDMPLKHATKMLPFVKKLTGVELEPGTDSDPGTITESLLPVNTSILTASKPIYVEAIAVFYQRNIILVESHLLAHENFVSPLSTDLSLATQVIFKIDDSLHPEMSTRVSKVLDASITMPTIFPKLSTCKVYVSADTESQPLFSMTALLYSLRRSLVCSEVRFDGVGSLQACFESPVCLTLIVQSRWTIDRWGNPLCQCQSLWASV